MLRESSDGITAPVDNPSLVYPEPPAFAEYMCHSSADLRAAALNWRSLDCRTGEPEIGKERNALTASSAAVSYTHLTLPTILLV